jgi:pullulanase/glycogen debranching enzyme
VDGFRFDLAELLGVEVLQEIEAALKRVKPDVILIAEPWSFRGHIAARCATPAGPRGTTATGTSCATSCAAGQRGELEYF